MTAIKQQSMADLNSIILMILGKQNEAATATDFMQKSILVLSAFLICLCYCYFISARIPKGFYRLISLIPTLCLFTILPLFLPPVFSSMIIASLITWPSIGRLILFAFGKGSIPSPSQSLCYFIIYAALPIRMTPSSTLPSNPTKKVAVLDNLGAKIVIFAVFIGFMSQVKEVSHPRVIMVMYGVFLFLYLECMAASAKSMFRALSGLDLVPMFDEPYFSTSLQDFWGKRWNLVVSSALRQAVYNPVRSAAVVLLGKGFAPVAAYLAAFTVSGLMHELFLYGLTRANPSWEMTAFFVVHGICVVLEVGLKKALKGRLSLPWWFVSAPLTVGFLVLTSLWLFFPPVIRGGVDRIVFREFRYWREFFESGIALIGF